MSRYVVPAVFGLALALGAVRSQEVIPRMPTPLPVKIPADARPVGPPKADQEKLRRELPILPAKSEPGVVAPEALADSYFRLGQFDRALETYQLLDLVGMRAGDRLAVRYMMATCLRKLGKVNEAKVIYREIANAKGDERLAQCARWQLGNIAWRQETEAQLGDLRRRLKNLEKAP